MRHFITVAVTTMVFGLDLWAQESATEQKLPTYRFNVSVPVVRCTLEGASIGVDISHPPVGSKFVYIRDFISAPQGGTPKSLVVLQFLDWNDTTEKFRTFNALEGTKSTDRHGRKTFCVDKTIFDRTTERTYAWGRPSWDLAAGVLLLPIKMRLNEFDFSRDVTLGTVVGPRWRLSPTRNVFLSFLGGAGVAAVTLDSGSTSGVVRESTDRAAVTLTLGPRLEINSFQMGLLLGWDLISNPNRSDWIHHGKPWISLGLGYSLLRPAPNAPATKQ